MVSGAPQWCREPRSGVGSPAHYIHNIHNTPLYTLLHLPLSAAVVFSEGRDTDTLWAASSDLYTLSARLAAAAAFSALAAASAASAASAAAVVAADSADATSPPSPARASGSVLRRRRFPVRLVLNGSA